MPIPAETNEFPYVTFDEQASDVSTPSTGLWRAFAKSDGLYVIDDAGEVTGPFGSGGGGDLVEIDTQTVTGSDGTLMFSSIPATYRDLLLVAKLRDDAAGGGGNNANIRVGNGTIDTGTNYDYGYRVDRMLASSLDFTDAAADRWFSGTIATDGLAAGYFAPFKLEVFGYSLTTALKTMQLRSSCLITGQTRFSTGQGTWNNSSDPIDTVEISGDSLGNLKVGSTATLYGRGQA